jgi:hypothetical protein
MPANFVAGTRDALCPPYEASSQRSAGPRDARAPQDEVGYSAGVVLAPAALAAASAASRCAFFST